MTHGPTAPRKDIADGGEEEAQLPAPPDGGWGWMVAFASFAIHIVSKYPVVYINHCKIKISFIIIIPHSFHLFPSEQSPTFPVNINVTNSTRAFNISLI
uniref:Monocarboxylate transporter n=1 Tax=Phlebotomus papatasi TaxID=29031 RepID=A0A1B0D4Y6_PHLPP